MTTTYNQAGRDPEPASETPLKYIAVAIVIAYALLALVLLLSA
jgi:hypothetical protein